MKAHIQMVEDGKYEWEVFRGFTLVAFGVETSEIHAKVKSALAIRKLS